MISAVVLTHNDDETVAKTLESLAWCDEIVVVDDYSTDATLSLVKKYTPNVYRRHLNADFASQRNFGLSKAKDEWVLFVDSDEIVTDELAKEIQELVSSRAKRGDLGFFIKRRDVLWGRELKHGEQGNIKLLRLAKKDAGVWERPVHEVWHVKGRTAKLNASLLHFPHPSVAQFLSEINRYSTLNARYLYEQNIRGD